MANLQSNYIYSYPQQSACMHVHDRMDTDIYMEVSQR